MAGARSMDAIAAVWSDDVLRKLASWEGERMGRRPGDVFSKP